MRTHVAPDGGILVAGYTTGGLDGHTNAGSPSADTVVIKLDASGAWSWTVQRGTSAYHGDICTALQVAPDGGILLAGYAHGGLDGNTNSGDQDMVVMKLNASGAWSWTVQRGTSGSDSARALQVAPDGGILVAGSTTGDLDGNTNAGGSDIFIMKLDASGAWSWTVQRGTSMHDNPAAMQVAPDGGILVAGGTQGDLDGNTNAGGHDIFIMKLDASGAWSWTVLRGSSLDEVARDMQVASDGGILVVGDTTGDLDANTNAGSLDIYVMKFATTTTTTATSTTTTKSMTTTSTKTSSTSTTRTSSSTATTTSSSTTATFTSTKTSMTTTSTTASSTSTTRTSSSTATSMTASSTSSLSFTSTSSRTTTSRSSSSSSTTLSTSTTITSSSTSATSSSTTSSSVTVTSSKTTTMSSSATSTTSSSSITTTLSITSSTDTTQTATITTATISTSSTSTFSTSATTVTCEAGQHACSIFDYGSDGRPSKAPKVQCLSRCCDDTAWTCLPNNSSASCWMKAAGPCPPLPCAADEIPCYSTPYNAAHFSCYAAAEGCPCDEQQTECFIRGQHVCFPKETSCPVDCQGLPECHHESGNTSCATSTGCRCEDGEFPCRQQDSNLTICLAEDWCPKTCEEHQELCALTSFKDGRQYITQNCSWDTVCPRVWCDNVTARLCNVGGYDFCVDRGAECPCADKECSVENFDAQGNFLSFSTKCVSNNVPCECGDNAKLCGAYCVPAAEVCCDNATSRWCYALSRTAEGSVDFAKEPEATCMPNSELCGCGVNTNAKPCTWTDNSGRQRQQCVWEGDDCPCTSKQCVKVDYNSSGSIRNVTKDCVANGDQSPCGDNAITCPTPGQDDTCLPPSAGRCPLNCPEGEEICYRVGFNNMGHPLLPPQEVCVPQGSKCGCGQNSFECNAGECLPLVGGYCPNCPAGEVQCPDVVNFRPDGTEESSVPPTPSCASSAELCPCGQSAKWCKSRERCVFQGEACCEDHEKLCTLTDYTEDGNVTGSQSICWPRGEEYKCPCGGHAVWCPSANQCVPEFAKKQTCPCNAWQKMCYVTDYTETGVTSGTAPACVDREQDCPCGQNSLTCPDPRDPTRMECPPRVQSGIATSCPMPCSREQERQGNLTCTKIDFLPPGVYRQSTGCFPPDACKPGVSMKSCQSGAFIPVWWKCDLSRTANRLTTSQVLETSQVTIRICERTETAFESLPNVAIELRSLLEIPHWMTSIAVFVWENVEFVITGPGKMNSTTRRLQGANDSVWGSPDDLANRLAREVRQKSARVAKTLAPIGELCGDAFVATVRLQQEEDTTSTPGEEDTTTTTTSTPGKEGFQLLLALAAGSGSTVALIIAFGIIYKGWRRPTPRKVVQDDLGEQEEGYDLADPQKLVAYFVECDVRPVRLEFLEQLREMNKPLPRRQEAESLRAPSGASALVELDELSSLLFKENQFVTKSDKVIRLGSLSHCWESREHPDPWNFQLAQTVDHFRHKQGQQSEIWIFIDYTSLHQYKRSAFQQGVFSKALDQMHVLYAHEAMKVYILAELTPKEVKEEMGHIRPHLPVYREEQDAVVDTPISELILNDNPYEKRGWCQAEMEWASLREAGARVPLPPAVFAKKMDQMKFTHRNDTDCVKELQSKVFLEKISKTQFLNLRGLESEQVEVLCKALPHYRFLNAITVADTSLGCQGVQAVMSCRARHVYLINCGIGDTEAAVIADILSSGTAVEELSLRDAQVTSEGMALLQQGLATFRTVTMDVNGRRLSQVLAPAGPAGAVCARELPKLPGEVENSDVDLRDTEWYAHYLQSVFSAIQGCYDDGATGIVLMAICPSSFEWCCLQEDLRRAETEQSYPFYSKGLEITPLNVISSRTVALECLRDELLSASADGKFVIIASCTEKDSQEAITVMKEHNANREATHGPVRGAWSPSERLLYVESADQGPRSATALPEGCPHTLV
ncbi:flaEY [Symbiodinium natans]|uniref:FlaEY protein n=1 Tax=Symbiodinium natans TaxID=878477 RepID=A0A812S9W5_9DINO|nr:flaEY [Symbiodinium natans]